MNKLMSKQIKPLFYKGYELQCKVDSNRIETTIVYSTKVDGIQEQRAEYKVSREVWDTLDALLGAAHDLNNLHFCGYWLMPSNQELIDRVVKGWKPCGSLVYADKYQSPEQDAEIAWLDERVANPSIDSRVEVFKVPVSDGHTKFLIGSKRTMSNLLNWRGFVALAKNQGWAVRAEWGELKPLELLILQGEVFEYPSGDENHWSVGLALGYHPATTASFIDGSLNIEDSCLWRY